MGSLIASALIVAAAAVPHAPDAVVRTIALPGSGAVLVAADADGGQDRDWRSTLWRVDDAGARPLARGLYHASRPLVSRDGLVYVERGASGPWPTREQAQRGELRADALAIDAIDPVTGDARRVATWTGYTMHLAGEHGGELVVYRVAYGVAELVAIDRARGGVRVIAAVLPFARDFTVDAARGSITMTNRDATDAHLWTLERVDLATGARERLAQERDRRPAIAPPAGAAVLDDVRTLAEPQIGYCPSYTPGETAGGQSCGVDPIAGANPTPGAWQSIFAKVSPGEASWGTGGPTIGTMGVGCGKPIASHPVPAHFPCHVLQAIAMQESGWRQFCVPTAPAGSTGAPERTLVSFDCGYGVGQVTSGMHVGETPAFDRARVAGDPTYNLATGTLILRDKWAATKCVGDNDPDVVEDWYTAIWAYNGLAYSNNPSNPNLTANRGVYDPSKGTGSYTYQERVLGWMEHPPGATYWPALAVAYPNAGDVGGSGAPPDLPEPSCASPTDCTQHRSTHASTCGAAITHDAGAGPGDGGSSPADDGGAIAPPPVDVDAAVPVGAGPTPPSSVSGSPGCSCRDARARPRSDLAWLALLGALGVIARVARRSARR